MGKAFVEMVLGLCHCQPGKWEVVSHYFSGHLCMCVFVLLGDLKVEFTNYSNKQTK